MKKQLVFLSIFLFLASTYLDAQVRYGVRGSGSITNLTKAHSISKSRTGYQIGAFGLIPLDNKDQFFFQPEVHYSAQGEFNVHEYRGTDQPDKDIKTFTSFVNVPIFVRYFISSAEDEFFVEGGPYLGFKVGENIERIEGTEPFDEEYSSFDFGLGLGIGYSFNRSFELSLRYNYGFVDQVERDASNTNNHNSVLNFGLSYVFY